MDRTRDRQLAAVPEADWEEMKALRRAYEGRIVSPEVCLRTT